MWIFRLDLFLKVLPHFSQATLATEASLFWPPVLLLPTLASEETSASEWTSRWCLASAAFVCSDSPHERQLAVLDDVASEASTETPEVPADKISGLQTDIRLTLPRNNRTSPSRMGLRTNAAGFT